MNHEFSAHHAKKSQDEAQWAYQKRKEKFYYSMLEVIFLRIKSHLNETGLKKVMEMDEKRTDNENFSIEFSQKTWVALAEAWIEAEGLAMRKIADLYGLKVTDFEISKISPAKDSNCPDNCS